MKTNLKKLLSLCLAGIVTAGMAISASAIDVTNVTTNNEIPGNDAILSVDGDDTRLWHTNWVYGPFEPPFIITYEFAEVCEISTIGLYPRQDGNLNGLPYVLNINVSDDGVKFTTAETVDWLEYTYDLQTIELQKPVTTKYLQLEILETEGIEFASLNQLYINGDAAILTVKETAEDIPVIEVASVTTNNEIAGNDAFLSVDGDNSRLWHTDWENGPFEPPFIITYGFAEACEISSIGLYPRQDGTLNGLPYNLNINVSDDGVNFTTVQTVEGLALTYNIQTIELSTPVTTKYIQLEILETEGHNFASLNQLYVNGAVAILTVEETEAPVVETEAPAPETEAPEAPVVETEAPDAAETVTEVVEVPAAPQTFDFGVIAAIAAVISVAGYAVTRRRV